MLQRLKGSERDAELLTRLEIVDSQIHGLRHGAHRLGTECCSGLVEHTCQHGGAVASVSQQFGVHRGELYRRHRHAVIAGDGLAPHARRTSVDEEQRRRVISLRRDHELVRASAMQHRLLATAERPVFADARGAGHPGVSGVAR